MDKFDLYYDFLISENEKYNLTAITEREEVFIKHFDDSLKPSLVIDFDKIETICDIGSGAGFPGIPLKIKYPHLKLTIIEPTLKRCKFLSQLVFKLDLKDVIIINDRAENIGNLREKFDVVVARAVSNLRMLLELTIPYVKVDGYFVALKGSNYEEEIKLASNAFKVLDIVIDEIKTYELDKGYGLHSLIKIKKLKPTNIKYPRAYGVIKNKPL